MGFKKIIGIIGGVIFLLIVLAGIFGSSSINKSGIASPTSSPSPQLEPVVTQITTTPSTTPSSTPSDPNTIVTKVSVVIDGDTIEIENGSRVRLIGIDTPETVDPNRPVGCYGKEASNFTKAQLEEKEVRLEKDVSETDKYGRLLRYVWLDDILFNEILVKEGYAQSSTYPPDVKYQDMFISAQSEARNGKKGLWGTVCEVTPTTKPIEPKSEPTKTLPPPSDGSCKYPCSGPDLDCKDFATHDEAQAFFNCCGFSAGNDPMRLDKATGTGNGLACESLP